METKTAPGTTYKFIDKEVSLALAPLIVPCLQVGIALIQVKRTNSLTFVIEGTTDLDTTTALWVPVGSVQQSSTGSAPRAPGATITAALSDIIKVAGAGYANIRVRVTAGDGSLRASTSPIGGSTIGGENASDEPYNTLGNTFQTTVVGNADTKIPANDTQGRLGVVVRNADATLDLWVQAVANGAGAPTISLTSAQWTIAPKGDRFLPFGAGIDLYARNSSGAATTSNVSAVEVLA